MMDQRDEFYIIFRKNSNLWHFCRKEKLCRKKTLLEIEKIYNDNNLRYTYKKFSKVRELNSLLSYLKHDKKNDDEKINFILLKTIGKTTLPNTQKISLNEIKKLALAISQG